MIKIHRAKCNFFNNSVKYFQSGTYDAASSLIDRFFTEEEHHTEERISPNKLKQVMIATPDYVKECAARATNKIKLADEVPVIIGYSGFLALQNVVQELAPNHTALIVLPDHIDTGNPEGYTLTKNDDGTTKVDFLKDEDIAGERTYGLIDNTTYTGRTFDKVTSYLEHRSPHAKVVQHPLYITRMKEPQPTT